MPTNVLIAGGGPAGLEAALRLHLLAAARAGADIDPEPFRPVIHGVLVTARTAGFMRSEPGGESRMAGRPLWWPPAKIAGRELAAYLEGVDEARGHVSGLPVDLALGGSGADEIEILR